MTDVDALRVPCPLCRSVAGSPCTYTWPAGVSPTGTSQAAVTARARYGRSTRLPHNERRRAWRNEWVRRAALQRRNEAERLRRTYRSGAQREVRRRAVLVEAMTEFDRREARRLRDWLRDNASLLSVAELDFRLRQAAALSDEDRGEER